MTKPLDQLRSSLADREWRIDNLYHVKTEGGESVRFVRNGSQRKFWENIHDRNIILKDRRRGFSTLIAIFILDTCFFRKDTAAGIIDVAERDAKKKLGKIKYAYDRMPETLRLMNPMIKRSETEVEWSNGSSVTVGTSHRGDTLQILHVSEYGKIAARNPIKAKEVKTGAFPAARAGIQFVESTAEGREGEFYKLTQTAKAKCDASSKLTKLDYKFHFFAWWMGSVNEIDPDGVVITPEQHEYFDSLETQLGITLSLRKRAWYVKEHETQQDDMLREYPSTPEEAFQASVDGAYFSKQMTMLRRAKRIRDIPVSPTLPVNTYWDIGKNDMMTIWLHQQFQGEHRMVGYYENSGETWAHYRRWYKDFLEAYDSLEGQHFAPHDIVNRQFGKERLVTAEELAREAGFNFIKVPRIAAKSIAIEYARKTIPIIWVDEARCATGIKHLDNYKKQWNDVLSVWRDDPLHDDASHGADGFMTFATALQTGLVRGEVKKKKRRAPVSWKVV